MNGTESGKGEETVVKSLVKNSKLLNKNSHITIPKLAEQVSITTRAVEKNIKKLQDAGSLKRVGPDKGGHREVVDKS